MIIDIKYDKQISQDEYTEAMCDYDKFIMANSVRKHKYNDDGTAIISTRGYTSWCREIAVAALSSIGNIPAHVSIHGIRRGKRGTSNQPIGMLGTISQVDEIDKPMNLLIDTVMIYMSLLDKEPPGCITIDTLLKLNKTWNSRPLYMNYESEYSSELPRIFLNEHPDATGIYGSITGIPVAWCKNRACMSFLMYLNRLWGAFYLDDMYLGRMIGKRSCINQNSNILQISTSRIDLAAIYDWLAVSRAFMLPSWYTNFGRGSFWAFLLFLVRNAYARVYGEDNKELRYFIDFMGEYRNRDMISGFNSWVNSCSGEDAPEWLYKIKETMSNVGPGPFISAAPIRHWA